MQQNNPKTDMELDAMYNMAAKFMNYTGPKTRKAMSQFANSNPGVAAKMGQYQQAMKGMSKPAQYNVGGAALAGAPYQVANNPFEAKAAVLPKFINPNTGQEYLNKNAAPDPSVLVPVDYSKPTFNPNDPLSKVKGGDPLANMISDQEKFYSGDQDVSKPFDYYLPGVYRPDDPQREVNPKYTGGVENVYETPTPEVFDINKDKFDADGFFGDPRRMRQDLMFDPATGTYSPIGMIPSTGLPEARIEITDGQPLGPSIGVDANTGNIVKGNDLSKQYYTDYENPRSDDELRAMYEVAQADAKAQRDSGFMGRVQLPGEMPFEDYAEMNRYQILPKDQGRPTVGGEMSSTPMPDGGTTTTTTEDGSPFSYEKDVVPLFGEAVKQTMDPTRPEVSQITGSANQFIGEGTGQVTGPSGYSAETVGTTAQSYVPTKTPTSTYTAEQIADGVGQEVDELDTSAYKTSVNTDSLVKAQQQTESSVSGMQAAQGTAYMMNNPTQRQIQNGELISGAADAQKAAQFTEQVQAATASPSVKATVAGQLDSLMKDFDGGKTPVWAAGAMRAATAQMAARGLGSSSLAGQAIIQAAMESAIPIAQADAATVARFESQNLSNRQQRAMLAAEQRAQFMGMEFDQAFQARVMNAAKISDVANMNFTAEQQVALENARATNTMNLANLSNSQAMVMAEAAALANLDMANLSNRQQAAVQNAQAFLETDFRNMDRISQMDTFKTQQKIQALFTDQAAENAARQFNASSENQTNQFFASLESQTSQFNASQKNAMEQFNVNAKNASKQFNADMKNQRQQFNARNSLVIAQANAQWRQNIATLNTAAQNEANMEYAKTINNLTSKNLDAVWQRERDLMSYNFTSEESAKNRALELIKADMDLEAMREKIGYSNDAAKTELAFRFLFGSSFGGLFG